MMLLRLSRLVRARPSRPINVRFTAPGHANPYFLDRAHFVDPSHPAATSKRLNLRSLPSFSCPQFTMRVFPNAILQEPVEFVPINPLLATGLVRSRKQACATNLSRRHKWWTNLEVSEAKHWRSKPSTGSGSHRTTWTTFHEKEGYRQWDNIDAARRHVKFVSARQVADAYVAALAMRGRRNVSLLHHTSKKATSKSSVIRRRLRSKMTAAFGLVVGRHADAVDAPETVDRPRAALHPRLNLVYHPLQEGERLVLQDWTYLVIPELAIYRMPLPNLVQLVRKALLHLGPRMLRLESTWSTPPKLRSSSKRVPRSSPLGQGRRDVDP